MSEPTPPPQQSLEDLVTKVAAELQKGHDKGQVRIAGINVANIWAIVLLVSGFAWPALLEVRSHVVTALSAVGEIKDAARSMDKSSALTAETLKELKQVQADLVKQMAANSTRQGNSE